MCAGNILTLLPDEISLLGLSEFPFSIFFFFFVTIIGLSLICQNEGGEKKNTRRRKFPHPLLKCSIFHPKAIPLSQGKYIYVRVFFFLCQNRLIFLQLLNTFLVSSKDGGSAED